MSDFDKLFSDSDHESEEILSDQHWKLLIADDDREVHDVTKLVLSDLVFDNKKLSMFDTYSGQSTIEFLKSNKDTAIVLLDVVMETDEEGLRVVKEIRDKLKNSSVRIILRTGQPGMAPERKVIHDYDINDYREKNDLSSQKLYTSVLSALRAYRDICQILDLNENLEKKVKEKTKELVRKNEELNLLNEGLKAMQAQLILQERIASVGNLAAGIAHEINNPLAYIKSNITMIEDYVKEIKSFINKHIITKDNNSDEINSILDDMEEMRWESMEGIEKVSEIIRSLREYSKVDSINEKEAYNINSSVDSILRIAAHYLKNFEIRKNFTREINIIYVEGGKVNQSILNIIMNSIQASETSKEKIITINTGNLENGIFLEIIDKGTGISEDIRGRIFDPFFTTKPVGKAKGLGLNIAYETIVNRHNGMIKVFSDPFYGTKIRIELPA
ncbi:MAG: hypothetical protein JXR48_06500 [Candidatus Delongbacteria bacterium]|nr:hypothetical protein [Candidatus Delongbacteria bacterium]MBN2834601.1 hypothetical protein [Candidatus Delongbacteria bacterium]